MIFCRPEDWPNRLEAHLARWRALPFIWGKFDCAHFVAEWAEKMGHTGILDELPVCNSPLAAARYYRQHGGWAEVIARHVALAGLPEIPRSFAGRGDLALVWIDDHRQALGIANGRRVEILTTDGVSSAPLHPNVVRSWRT